MKSHQCSDTSARSVRGYYWNNVSSLVRPFRFQVELPLDIVHNLTNSEEEFRQPTSGAMNLFEDVPLDRTELGYLGALVKEQPQRQRRRMAK